MTKKYAYKGTNNDQKIFFSTNEAAKYLDLSVSTIKYHLYRSKKLSAEMFGNSLMFTRDQLDEFKVTPRLVGRPPKKGDK